MPATAPAAPHPRLRHRLPHRLRCTALVGLLGLAALAAAPAVRAEGVLERVARTGQLQMIGPVDQPPMVSLDGQGQPQGYGVLVARRVAGLLSVAVGRPVTLNFSPEGDGLRLVQRLNDGQAELACGVPFTWARDEVLDFSTPIGVAGLRLMAPAGRFDGSPAALAGRRIGVVRDSLAETELLGMQPGARVVRFDNLSGAVAALASGGVAGVIGDSTILRGLSQQQGLQGMALTPEAPYERYAVACVMPENASAFRNLVNRAIAQLQQGYIDGDPATVAEVNRWIGPGSALNLSQQHIRDVFDSLLMGVEAIRPVPAGLGGR